MENITNQEKKEKDNSILTGVMWKAVLGFFFPILVGTLFQQLYNTVDAVIVGRYAGKLALSSVGGSSAILINLVVGFFTGLSSGCTVLISQYFGAKEKEKLARALHTSYAFAIGGGIILGILGVAATPALLRLMNTPDETLALSTVYMRVYFAGLIFVFIYNMGSAVLRALGDSKRPLYYLIACTFVNIIFDLVFVIAFNMGVLGVALATLIAQAVSAVLVTECLMNRSPFVKLRLKDIRIHLSHFKKMMKIGLPAGIQSSTYAISNMFIQSTINTFGVDTVAGWTAEGKVDVIFWMINGSFGVAAATVVGQNFGAKNMERVRKGTLVCLLMSLSSAVFLSFIFYFFGGYPLWLFTKEAEIVNIGAHMMRIIAPAYGVFVFTEIFAASLRARGNTIIPTFINISCIVGYRVIWIMLFGKSGNLDMILYCYPISWIICSAFMTGYYFIARRKDRVLMGEN